MHHESSTNSSNKTCSIIIYAGCAPEFWFLQVGVSRGELLGMNQAGLYMIWNRFRIGIRQGWYVNFHVPIARIYLTGSCMRTESGLKRVALKKFPSVSGNWKTTSPLFQTITYLCTYYAAIVWPYSDLLEAFSFGKWHKSLASLGSVTCLAPDLSSHAKIVTWWWIQQAVNRIKKTGRYS
jgi:hypothetical protein